ncbi:hypothetical protein COU60_03985 [Candidatus Pacearchaeota archaeon CG10_big_fil_rev_8_21_14_0_10_34_76]|nr:MAG: hypothetical protein COU60_03985 [Candidatus Pacearchaeota archaeon CG10_big_fil_rev_8_21_14_0_10_34_76]
MVVVPEERVELRNVTLEENPGRNFKTKYLMIPMSDEGEHVGYIFIRRNYLDDSDEPSGRHTLCLTLKRRIETVDGRVVPLSRIKLSQVMGYWDTESKIERRDHVRPIQTQIRPFNRIGWVKADLSDLIPTEWFVDQF